MLFSTSDYILKPVSEQEKDLRLDIGCYDIMYSIKMGENIIYYHPTSGGNSISSSKTIRENGSSENPRVIYSYLSYYEELFSYCLKL